NENRGVSTAGKISANRANARASTGPTTAQGRARSARNAHRHGLSLPVLVDPALSQEVEALAREMAGANASSEIQELARRIAEAQVDLRRVRCARPFSPVHLAISTMILPGPPARSQKVRRTPQHAWFD